MCADPRLIGKGVHDAGELLITESAARAAQFAAAGLAHRRLELRGKTSATEVIVLSVGQATGDSLNVG